MLSKTFLVSLVAASTFVAIAVGCSTPAVGTLGSDDTSTGENQPSAAATTSAVVDSGTAKIIATSDAGAGACFGTCIAATPAAAAFESCKADCADVTCENTCFSASCGGANATTCNTAITACQTACPVTPVVVDAGATTTGTCADQCIATTTAAQYWACSASCNDRNCNDDCFFDSPCGQSFLSEITCNNQIDQCANQCGGFN